MPKGLNPKPGGEMDSFDLYCFADLHAAQITYEQQTVVYKVE